MSNELACSIFHETVFRERDPHQVIAPDHIFVGLEGSRWKSVDSSADANTMMKLNQPGMSSE